MRRSADDDQVSTFECVRIGVGNPEDTDPWSEPLGDRGAISWSR